MDCQSALHQKAFLDCWFLNARSEDRSAPSFRRRSPMTRKTSHPFSLVVVLPIVFFTFVFPPAGLGQQVNTGSGILETAELSFLPVLTYGNSGIGVWGIVAADFNNDGKFDLAAAGSGTSIDIFLGNGDGILKRIVPGTASLIFPTNIAASDVNHDGKSDIVVSGIIPGS